VGEALGEDLIEVFFKDDSLIRTLEEAATDDLSVLLEGSVRTRANLFSYRSPAIMLGTIQNFRAGQLNFQSSVCQVSIHPSLNVFLTAGLEDIDISDLQAALGGGVFGGLLGAAADVALGGTAGILIPGLAVVGGAAGVIVNRAEATHQNLLVDHGDGPGWWTGSWSLPMIVQHDSAAILAFDFHSIQSLLAKCGSHAWFPKTAFNRVDEMRTSAYDDANFPLLDIGDIGPKGFWVFGKYIHPPRLGSHDRKEAYIGVFSNQRPAWQDQDSDFYKEQIKELVRDPIKSAQEDIDNALDDIKDEIGGTGGDFIKFFVDQAVQDSFLENISQEEWNKAAADALSKVTDVLVQGNLDKANALAKAEINLKVLQRVWPDPLPQDYFAGRDWYAKGKNIWIVQVGSREEFGDFQNFKDRVSTARIHLDDSGDMECSYDIPRAGGSSERLTMAYGDGGRFGLNGGPFQTDLYPRFENPFLRGGRVEWGQREYVIEYRGKSLLHDFSDFDHTTRQEQPSFTADQRNQVKALVIFLKTGDEDMDAFTVATADVGIGCQVMTKDQVVSAGPVGENTDHDAEWIFFDFPATRNPDMTLSVTHPPSTKGDDTPHWKMSFTLFALMGDRTVRPCSLSYSYFEFKDDKRTAPLFPFSVVLAEWRPWEVIADNKSPAFWMIGRQPDFANAYYDYIDLFALDSAGRLWHRRLKPCPAEDAGWFAVTDGKGIGAGEPDLKRNFFAAAVSARLETVYLAVQSQGTLFASQPSPSGDWIEGWLRVDVWTYPDLIFGIPDTNGPPMAVSLSASSPVAGIPSLAMLGGIEFSVLAADGNFYSRITWDPKDKGPWRKIDVVGFVPLFGAEFVVTGDYLFVLATDGSLWVAIVDHSGNHIRPNWEKVTFDNLAVSRFAATNVQGACQIVIATTLGGLRAATYRPGSPTSWVAIDLPGVPVGAGSPVASTSPTSGHSKFFTIGADGKIYSIDWESTDEWTPGMSWSEVAPGGEAIEVRTDGGMAAVSRVSGQIEIFAQTTDRTLVNAWWS